MKHVLTISILFLCLFSLTISPFPKSILKKQKLNQKYRGLNKFRHLEESTDTDAETDGGNSTYIPSSSSSGLSTGGIVAIAIPCIAALVGVGAAAAILGASAPAAAPVLANAAAVIPPPTYVDTSMAQLAVPQQVPVQPVVPPEIVQPPVVEVPPQQPVVLQKIEPPVVQKIIPQQPVVQPQMVPVQEMQFVPVQQVEMVPVQHVEMVPVQQVVPTVQTEVIPQVNQIGVQGVQQIGQGIQGGEFITAPEGYGTSVIQSGTNAFNGEFSTNNLI